MHDQPIDFAGLAAALLDRIDQLLPMWLPGGSRNGPEYECADFSGGAGKSCKVNVHTGRWADFASDDAGGDLISLYAAIKGVNNGKAARLIMEEMGWAKAREQRPHAPAPVAPPPATASAQRTDGGKAAPRTTWTPIVPVPPTAPVPSLKHFERGEPEASWAYRHGDDLLGYVARYRTSDGGKDIVPWTWCQDMGDDRGLTKWHQKQWNEPRPLYMPTGSLGEPADTIVIVEGEKCAIAGSQALPDRVFVSWPGGGKAWDKAGWQMLSGRAVILWPDCDAKHEKLTKAERDAGVDPASKPFLAEARQPGVSTMRALGAHLVGLGCSVSICPLPAPGNVADGWDIADAIAAGWAAEQLQAFLAAARPLTDGPAAEPEPQADAPHPPAGARRGRDRSDWRSHLLLTDKGAVKACRENIVLALDGQGQGVPGVPEAAGIIAFNEFTNNVVKLKPTPWGTASGEWLEEDELEMGAWLVREHWLPSMPRTALEEAVKMVAGRHRYHPVREYLSTVRDTWDGTQRLRGWLKRVCNAQAPEGLEEVTGKYLARVGSWMLMAMCARVLTPGCKYDYIVIFEGAQGAGKSTLARTLGGDWFADTGLVLGDKDAYQNLQGVWVYEIGELDSFSKAEVTKVKSFASSSKDRFRASFDRRPRDYPRQVIFVGTTNEDLYLTDPTGNRRMWPVRVQGQVDNIWLRENRDQLFAEALNALEQGHRFHPTTEEQRELFDPQQGARTVESSIEARIVTYLYDPDQHLPHGAANGAFVNEITLVELLQRIGIGLEKLGPGRFHEKQAGAALKRLGWTYGKSSAKGGAVRQSVYKRPPMGTPSPAHVQSHQTTEATDAVPF